MREFTQQETAAWFASLEKRMSSAHVAIHDDQDRVLVVKANYKNYWSFPGGIVDAGETPLQAGIREAKEEVGLTLAADTIHFNFVVDRVSSFAQTYLFMFETHVPSSMFNDIVLDANELDEYAIVTRQQILNNDREYGESARHWAEGFSGYLEQSFMRGTRQSDI